MSKGETPVSNACRKALVEGSGWGVRVESVMKSFTCRYRCF